jgi:hypothetical protein
MCEAKSWPVQRQGVTTTTKVCVHSLSPPMAVDIGTNGVRGIQWAEEIGVNYLRYPTHQFKLMGSAHSDY